MTELGFESESPAEVPEELEQQEPQPDTDSELDELLQRTQETQAKADRWEELAAERSGESEVLHEYHDDLQAQLDGEQPQETEEPTEEADDFDQQLDALSTPEEQPEDAPNVDELLESFESEPEPQQVQPEPQYEPESQQYEEPQYSREQLHADLGSETELFFQANSDLREQYPQIGQRMATMLKPYMQGDHPPEQVRMLFRSALHSAATQQRSENLARQKETHKIRQASQISERRLSKVRAAVSGAGNSAPPRPRAKRVEDMTAAEADAALIKEFGDGHHRRR